MVAFKINIDKKRYNFCSEVSTLNLIYLKVKPFDMTSSEISEYKKTKLN